MSNQNEKPTRQFFLRSEVYGLFYALSTNNIWTKELSNLKHDRDSLTTGYRLARDTLGDNLETLENRDLAQMINESPQVKHAILNSVLAMVEAGVISADELITGVEPFKNPDAETSILNDYGPAMG